ncbi:transcriptional regulator, TetR family [Leptospira ryugenii]|uniref:Transcriptional regulator, TetR family n=1 Tax=Leptospira ryugenii TaxID=1917863 RepID=A0A2P2DV87_9LEPT|nr:TetR/AcrR family transcriptional regulator [Leptospira ryugenii]GBF48534.1 transcriptional regulator, TetR family [Leptospira ryugenii]
MEETEIKILEFSEPYFIRKYYSKASLDEIASELGISKKTIYKYFDSKESLQVRCTEARIQRINTQILKIFESQRDFLQKIDEVSTLMTVKENLLSAEYFSDLKKHCPKAWKRFQENQNTFIPEILKKTIEEGIKKKFIKKDINIEVSIAVYLMLMRSLIDGSYEHHIVSRYSPNELKQTFNDIFFRGILRRD